MSEPCRLDGGRGIRSTRRQSSPHPLHLLSLTWVVCIKKCPKHLKKQSFNAEKAALRKGIKACNRRCPVLTMLCVPDIFYLSTRSLLYVRGGRFLSLWEMKCGFYSNMARCFADQAQL